MTKNNKKIKQKKSGGFLWTVALIIAIGVFCYSGYQLLKISLEYKKGTDEYSALAQYADVNEVETETEAESGGNEENVTLTAKNPIDFSELKKINEEIIGWLRVKAIDITYPVAQTTDNEYYLHNTFEKKPVFAGCIFMDYKNKKDFSDKNTLIYGHNMKNGSMFGKLKNFYDQGVYDSNPYFWIYTPDKILKYEIFSCQEVSTTSQSYQISFQDDKEFVSYLEEAKQNSAVKNDVKVDSKDHIVTLSTCTGDETTRFIVQGKLIKTYLTE